MSEEIGAFLRQTRRQMGLTLEEVQERTKIQISFLEAIENGEFHKLPSPFYVRTYLRSYANCLKIEPQHILRQYRKIDQEERLHYTNPKHKVGSDSSMAGLYRSHSDKIKSKNQRLDPRKAMIVASKPFSYSKMSTNAAKTNVSKTNAAKHATTRLSAFQTQQINAHFTDPSNREIPSNREVAASREDVFRKDFLKHQSVPPSPSFNRIQPEKRFGQQTSQLNVNKINHAVNQSRNSTDIFPAVKGNYPLRESSSSSFQRKKGGTSPKLFSSQTGPLRKSSPGMEARLDDTLGRGRTKEPQKNTGKRNSILFIALAVICIPLLLLGYVLFGKDDGETSQQPKETQNSVTNNEKAPNASANERQATSNESTARLVRSETLANTYYLEGGKELNITIEAEDEEVWVGISNKESKKNLIEDVLLKPDEAPFKMVHLFDETTSLYIYLGRPHSTKVSINNESIESASVIKIKKRE